MKKPLILLASGLLCPLALVAQNLDWKSADVYKKADTKTQLATRLTNYAKQETATPAQQVKFAKNLVKELRKYGADVTQSKSGLTIATLPGNVKGNLPTLVFLSRLHSSAPKANTQVHHNYTGGQIDINLPKHQVLDVYNAPQLTRAYGHDLLTTDGETSLGAEAKAGTAILLTVLQYLDEHPGISHGNVQFVFLPQNGLTELNPKDLSNSFGYLVSGADRGELADKTFSGKQFKITFEGMRDVPLGQAAGSAFADNVLIASDFHTLLPRHLRPETTSGERGFIYVDSITHSGNKTEITGIVRALSDKEMDQLTAEVSRAFKTVKALNSKAHNFTLDFEDQFTNIKPAIPPAALALAEKALKAEDIKPKRVANRTQTDLSLLAAKGFAAPILFAGHYNDNTPLEYVDLDVMEDSFRTIMRLISLATLPQTPGN